MASIMTLKKPSMGRMHEARPQLAGASPGRARAGKLYSLLSGKRKTQKSCLTLQIKKTGLSKRCFGPRSFGK